jgi:hypothetical protein
MLQAQKPQQGVDPDRRAAQPPVKQRTPNSALNSAMKRSSSRFGVHPGQLGRQALEYLG